MRPRTFLILSSNNELSMGAGSHILTDPLYLSKTFRIDSENLAIFQPDIEQSINIWGGGVPAWVPADLVYLWWILSWKQLWSNTCSQPKGALSYRTAAPACQTRMAPLHIITLNHFLSDHWNTRAVRSNSLGLKKKCTRVLFRRRISTFKKNSLCEMTESRTFKR